MLPTDDLLSPPATPPAHPPLAAPTTPSGQAQPARPPSYEPTAAPSGTLGGPRSAATAGLPPLPVPPGPTRPARRHGGPWLAALAGVVVVIVVAAVVVWARSGSTSHRGRSSSAKSSASSPQALDVPALRQSAADSVVGLVPSADAAAAVAGSGTAVNASGLVVTTPAVVGGADQLQAVLPDGRRVTAQLVGTLPDDGVALVQVSGAAGLSSPTLGHSSAVTSGAEVVAVGAPAQARGLATGAEGLVTGTDQTASVGSSSLSDLIETDAAVPADAAGGPLLDAKGEVVGINVIADHAGSSHGYALGIDAVLPLVAQIQQGHAQDTPSSPTLGVTAQDVSTLDPAQVAQYGVLTSDGAMVVHVASPSSAADAGLAVGDVITAIDSQPVNTADDVAGALADDQAGDQVQVTFERQGQIHNVTVTLRARRDTGN